MLTDESSSRAVFLNAEGFIIEPEEPIRMIAVGPEEGSDPCVMQCRRDKLAGYFSDGFL
jgi:hypothetical protein